MRAVILGIVKTLLMLWSFSMGAWQATSGGWEPISGFILGLIGYLTAEFLEPRTSAGHFAKTLTLRDIHLPDAVRRVGLVDIELRDSKDQKYPPERLVGLADRELLLSGTTLAGTVGRHADAIERLLENGRHVLLLLVDPDSADLIRIGDLVGRDLRSEVSATLTLIQARRFHRFAAFHVRFLNLQPPYTSVLIDGAILVGSGPDRKSQIRVQFGTAQTTQCEGIVCQFTRVSDGGYRVFRDDVLFQWTNLAHERPELWRPKEGRGA